MRVSILIPAHNAAARIGIPLGALARQRGVTQQVEVIVVNNASTDGTAEVAMREARAAGLQQRGWRVRVTREPRLGLTAARLRGLREAAGRVVCFLDDDTEPGPDYVATGLQAMQREDVGVLVSRVVPKYQIPPPPAVWRREHLLAINYFLGDQPIEWPGDGSVAPTLGAGLWARRDQCLRAMTSGSPLLPDRTGERLGSGGDIEIGIRIGQMGLKRLYVPKLVLHHHIPAARMRWRYVCRLIIGIVRGELTLARRYSQLPAPPSRWMAVGSLLVGVGALPLLVSRADGLREAAFVLADRWARVLGPFSMCDIESAVQEAAEVMT